MEKLIALSVNGIPIHGAGGAPEGGAGIALDKIITTGISLAILVAIILCVIFIIIGGINWIMSGGDKQKLEQAHRRVTFAIIGLIVVFLAFAILRLINIIFLG